MALILSSADTLDKITCVIGASTAGAVGAFSSSTLFNAGFNKVKCTSTGTATPKYDDGAGWVVMTTNTEYTLTSQLKICVEGGDNLTFEIYK